MSLDNRITKTLSILKSLFSESYDDLGVAIHVWLATASSIGSRSLYASHIMQVYPLPYNADSQVKEA